MLGLGLVSVLGIWPYTVGVRLSIHAWFWLGVSVGHRALYCRGEVPLPVPLPVPHRVSISVGFQSQGRISGSSSQ